jgi:hypothetical protein
MFANGSQLHAVKNSVGISKGFLIACRCCYKLAAVNYRKTQIEALNKRIKKKKGWK